ncbi:MAG: MBL fold hydrolase [Candidatus Hydrogenedentota bacterium]
MESPNYIQFLGTAGSRWVVARQLRASAGIYLNLCGRKVCLDPGPGALVRCNMVDPPIDPSSLDGLVLTHSHIDHCNDVNIMIDAMTAGGFNKGGALFAPKSCLEGENRVLLNYLRPFLDSIVTLEPSQEYNLGELRFVTSIPHHHGPDVFGITFVVDDYRLAFLVDTKYFPELSADYVGADLLIINVTFLDKPPHPKILHLCTHDVKEIVREVRPRRVILTHFGTSMLEAGPHCVAARLTDELGVEIVAADDGMIVPIP